jgi:hypothetical protein
MSKRRWFWTAERDQLLRDHYDSQTETITRLARCLGFPRFAVRSRAMALGLARTKELAWSAEDQAYVLANWHRLAVVTMAKHLGRTKTAVALKAKRLGAKQGAEGYTMRGVAVALGVDAHKVRKWIDAGLLPASRRRTARVKNDYRYISHRALRAFVIENPGELDRHKVDLLWLIGLVAGRVGPTQVV